MIFCGIGDAKELSVMAKEIWMDYYPSVAGGKLAEYVVNNFQSEEAIIQQIKEGYLYSFIMKDDAKAGYFSIRHTGDSLYLSKFYLSKEFRGMGLGSKTMDEILEKGRELKVRRVFLRANKNNKPSIEIYKHKGFVIAEAIEEDIGNGFCLDDYLLEYVFER
jgi:ribosomal protein S18 acetylase RimI-like enzyme